MKRNGWVGNSSSSSFIATCPKELVENRRKYGYEMLATTDQELKDWICDRWGYDDFQDLDAAAIGFYAKYALEIAKGNGVFSGSMEQGGEDGFERLFKSLGFTIEWEDM